MAGENSCMDCARLMNGKDGLQEKQKLHLVKTKEQVNSKEKSMIRVMKPGSSKCICQVRLEVPMH